METATDLELEIFIDNYELVMSRTVNLFSRKLTVCFDNLVFDIEFLRRKHRNASAECAKKENGDTTDYNIKIYDSDTGVHGLSRKSIFC